MSAGMEIHELRIKRASETRGALGGVLTTYTDAARGSLPLKVRGRAMVMNVKEKVDHGIRAEQYGWKLLVPQSQGDPQITLQDQVTFEYAPGDTRTVKITVPSRPRLNGPGDVHHYTVIGVQDETES